MSGIRESIQAIAKNGNELYAKVCVVTAVNGKRVDVEPLDGTAGLYDVPLQADVQGDGLIGIPTEGSKVLVVFTGKHTAVVCQVSEVGTFRYSQSGLVFELDSEAGKMQLSNADTSLLQLFTDLKSLIAGLKVNTPAGPSTGLLPDSMQALNDFETAFKNLLK
jgi:hypothetical protein